MRGSVKRCMLDLMGYGERERGVGGGGGGIMEISVDDSNNSVETEQ